MFAYFHYSSIIFKQIINILSRIINIINRKRDNNAIILFLFTAATASLSLEVNAEEQNPNRIEADNVSISGLEIKGLKLHHISKNIAPKGIYVAEGSDDVSITNCTIHDMGIREYDPAINKKTDSYNAHGILAVAQPYNPIKNLKIKKCTLYNLTLGNSEALVVNGNVDNFEISGNYVHDCDNIGIDAICYEQTTDEDSAEKVELDRAHDGRIFENIVKKTD